MADKLVEIPDALRDGTSQAARARLDLLPDNFRIDERSAADLLARAKAVAGQLRFYDAESLAGWYESGRLPTATWAGLFSGIDDADGEISLADAAAFIDRPAAFDGRPLPALRRPHVMLLLSFLQLFGHARDAVNGILGRHLDYYYREVLRLVPRAAEPDRVFVLFQPATGVSFTEVADGTLLDAGRDAGGNDRRYRVDLGMDRGPASPVPASLVVGRARIAEKRSIHADVRRIGLVDVRQQLIGTVSDDLLATLQIALWDLDPGDTPPADWTGASITAARLQTLAALVAFAGDKLFLALFELRQLVTTLRRQDSADTAQAWTTILDLLENAGRAKRAAAGARWNLDRNPPHNFDRDLERALGLTPTVFKNPEWFQGISQVETLDDLYNQRARTEVAAAIAAKLFMTVDNFVELMNTKRWLDAPWQIINNLLEQAGKRKRGNDFTLSLTDPTAFVANFTQALDNPFAPTDPKAGIFAYHDQLAGLERTFFMPAEDFRTMMAIVLVAAAGAAVPDWRTEVALADWQRIDVLLTDAHGRKVYALRRDALHDERAAAEAKARTSLSAKPETESLLAIVATAAGSDASASVDAVDPFTTPDEQAVLDALVQRLDRPPAMTESEWAPAYDVLERAMRKRERLPKPVPQREEWRNLFAFADATTATAVTFGRDTDGLARWKLFGRSEDTATAPEERIGLAIGSPALMLSAGHRVITLTLGVRLASGAMPAFDAAERPFRVMLSTAKGWWEAEVTGLQSVTYGGLPELTLPVTGPPLPALQLTITLPAEADAIVPPRADDALPGCPWPVLKLMLRQLAEGDPAASNYARLRGLDIVRVHLRVAVGSLAVTGATGLAPLSVETDDGIQNGKKPFQPFGHAPATGARLFVGHPDLYSKRLTKLKFWLSWMGGPTNLTGWYAGYPLPPNFAFTADVSLVDDGFSTTAARKSAPLFADTSTTTTQSIDVTVTDKRQRPFPADAFGAPLPGSVREWDRVVRWTLNSPDFQHTAYPAAATAKAVKLAVDIAKNTVGNADTYTINPPYTPKLSSLSLDFEAVHEIVAATYRRGPETDQLFHLHPFGAAEVTAPVVANDGIPLLPSYDHEGELLIGLADAVPPQSLSMLFQLADGSGDPDLERRPITWSYLDGDRWVPFTGEQIAADTTRGLINSGIIDFRLQPVRPATAMPAGLYWLRATIAQNAASVCDAVDLHTNAALAVFVDAGNDPSHYATPLPAASITEPVGRLPDLGPVSQPYTSFGGRAADAPAAFYMRVSERLRHKGRAVTAWDYERLVMDRFPDVYKAKCLPARLADAPTGEDDDRLGVVRLVVIPDIRHRRPFDPFQPKLSADVIADIEEFLAGKVPPTARLRVVNPDYVEVQIRVGVRFRDAGNDAFYTARLIEDLNRYLSPWAYDEGADIIIGRRIYANGIVAFIDERPYVDFVAGIKLFSRNANGDFILARRTDRPGEGYFVEAPSPSAILVAAQEHVIDIIPDEIFEEQVFTGIGYMRIELDFIVA